MLAVLLIAGCARHPVVQTSPKISIYYCKAGSDDLVRMLFTVDPKLKGPAVATYALNQLIAGPSVGRDSLVLFPTGTQGSVTTDDDMATVNLTGPIARSFQGGAGDEAGLFKSLTYTMTSLPGVKSVQVLVDGRKQAALPGGHFELDDPLTRDTFAQ